MSPRSPLLPVVGWPADVAASYRQAGYWQEETLDAFLLERARRHPDRVAVVGRRAADPAVRCELTYAALVEEVGRFAGTLAQAGVQRGDRVIVQLPNTVDFVVSVFATFRLGALPVFAIPAHRELEIAQFARLTDASAHVVAGARWGHDYLALARRVADALTDSGHRPPVVIDVEQTDGPAAPPVPPGRTSRELAESTAFLQVSGGTTQVPKLIPRTHADYLYSVRESARLCGVQESTVMLVVLPAAHNFAMSSPGILGVLERGGRIVLAPDTSPRTSFGLIESERVTMTSLVPPLLHAWLSSRQRARHDLSSLALVQVGGSRLADSVAPRVRSELGAGLQQVFGMAEGLVNYTRLDDPEPLVATTQGRPISPADEILVVDAEDRPVPPGEEGELLTRGPYTIRGYYGDDEQHALRFTPDGFYRTGDLVRQLPSGHLQVLGRAKDQINRGGDKVAVDEVESLVLTHPGVHDVAVVGAPDPYLGERSCAFVVLRGDQVLGAEELRAHLREAGIAAFKVPDEFHFLDAFPLTGVGKTSRRDLRTALARTLPSR